MLLTSKDIGWMLVAPSITVLDRTASASTGDCEDWVAIESVEIPVGVSISARVLKVGSPSTITWKRMNDHYIHGINDK